MQPWFALCFLTLQCPYHWPITSHIYRDVQSYLGQWSLHVTYDNQEANEYILTAWVKNAIWQVWPLPHQLCPCHTNILPFYHYWPHKLWLALTHICFGHTNFGNRPPPMNDRDKISTILTKTWKKTIRVSHSDPLDHQVPCPRPEVKRTWASPLREAGPSRNATLAHPCPCTIRSFFFYKVSPNLLNGLICEARARAKQSLLRRSWHMALGPDLYTYSPIGKFQVTGRI